ncbi:MAG: isoprenylcysteine carboxylmethyltransferase family protein [Proteobacteria bacterium]|nr:isoprenylcysteine carboxylmethyltransferase family protein [Pseudomonadota bacterium]MBU1741526.1 isoprenylcysteine carboxylmethyltransferase family protein [Pseudomonadota bacterium]
MFGKLVDFIVRVSGRERSTRFKVVAIAFGATVFLVLLPALGIYLGYLVSLVFSISCPRWLELVLGLASILVGAWWLGWSFLAQWRLGRGTPAPIAAPQRLIVLGPYKLCRNPIQLGALCYYFGLGAAVASLTAGLFCLVVFFILGSAYHKFIEEKELLIRFGEDYGRYRRRTPFLIPRPWRRSPVAGDQGRSGPGA